jgi:hypothetical protein
MQQVIHREHLVEADLRCLMCARYIGRLAGLVRRGSGAQVTTSPAVSWTAFRPASPGQMNVALTGRGRLRCPVCGGMAVMEDVTVSVVRQPPSPDGVCPIHLERVHGRGRRPKGCQCGALPLAA